MSVPSRSSTTWNEIAISEIRWDLGDTFKPFRVSSTKAVVRVDNNSARDQEVGVALAVFDADGTKLLLPDRRDEADREAPQVAAETETDSAPGELNPASPGTSRPA